jgi:hypothetical protein
MKIKSRRYAALLTAAFLASAMLGITKEGYAQYPGCAVCFHATPYLLPCQCQAGSPDSCQGCHSWGLTNNCHSCITQFSVTSKDGGRFIPCCTAVDSLMVGWWTVSPIGDTVSSVTYTAQPGTCLDSGRTVELTLCGLTTGDIVYVAWCPPDGLCGCMEQGEIVTVP